MGVRISLQHSPTVSRRRLTRVLHAGNEGGTRIQRRAPTPWLFRVGWLTEVGFLAAEGYRPSKKKSKKRDAERKEGPRPRSQPYDLRGGISRSIDRKETHHRNGRPREREPARLAETVEQLALPHHPSVTSVSADIRSRRSLFFWGGEKGVDSRVNETGSNGW